MAAPTIEDVKEYGKAQQDVVNDIINLTNELERYGAKYKPADKAALLSQIKQRLTDVVSLPDAASFAGARRPPTPVPGG